MTGSSSLSSKEVQGHDAYSRTAAFRDETVPERGRGTGYARHFEVDGPVMLLSVGPPKSRRAKQLPEGSTDDFPTPPLRSSQRPRAYVAVALGQFSFGC